MLLATLKTYYGLTKPGIIRGNLMTAAAGFFLAARGTVDWFLLAALLGGTALVIASGCVLNNYIDRKIDRKMMRTKDRALVTGKITTTHALLYATMLGLAGIVLLVLQTNLLTTSIGIAGLFFYVVVYGIAKRESTLGTVIGSISGATPPVAGYTAVTGQVDTAALLLLLILVFWQMPHFYAIAMYRAKDYANAGIPVLPVVKGMYRTKIYMLLYVAAFTVAAVLLSFTGFTGDVYASVILIISALWFYRGITGFKAADNTKWAHNMFGYSLIVLLLFSVMLSIDSLLR